MNLICTERLTMRLLTHDDALMILTLLNEDTFINNIGDKSVRNIEDAKAFIDNGPLALYQQYGYCMLCVVDNATNKQIGMCGLVKRDGIEHPEIGYALLKEFHGKGMGIEAAKGVLHQVIFENKIPVLNAICNPDNMPSIAVLTKLGFAYIKQMPLPPKGDIVALYEYKV